MTLVGLISDTHGLLRPEAVAALEGSDLILHAGDVGDPEILERLARVAPVRAVRGNTDAGGWAERLPLAVSTEIEGVPLFLHHGHLPPPLERLRAARVIVQGHSHRPEVTERAGKLYVNPGSAGPKRFRLPVTVALLRVGGGGVEAELVDIGQSLE